MRRLTVEPDAPADAILALAERFADETLDEAVGDDTARLLTQIAELAGRAGARAVVVDAEPATDALAAVAESSGFELVRTTLQLRRPLPLDPAARSGATPIATRAFRPGVDDDAWLRVNNRAFAWHPDQSDRTPADLERDEAEPWFRADGFLVHEGRGTAGDSLGIDGFCWTKIHGDHDPSLGEIYVIGVDPDCHGRGLGRSLVIAGLDWLAGQGLEQAMLYVEADNAPALHLYDSLGFREHHDHRWWRRTTGSGARPGPD
jgi:mycothiol synthase